MGFLILLLSLSEFLNTSVPSHSMQLGVDAENWHNEVNDPRFEKCLKQLGVNFIDWHIAPEDERSAIRLHAIVDFCRRNNWAYVFNNEIGNNVPMVSVFQHPDGTYRYDLANETLAELQYDPLFLGVVYDESDLVQAANGIRNGHGFTVEPTFAETRKLSAADAFLAIASKVTTLQQHYRDYNKRMIFEMTFPAGAFPYARGGATLAPKLLKETYNDLMYDVFRGAALEYHSTELWTCIDLWFFDKFPFGGKAQPGGHTPEQLFESLKYAYKSGFDYAYIEMLKGLVDDKYELSPYGEQVVAFQQWRKNQQAGDWRTAPADYYVKRFDDGYWGQEYSTFIPDHPYGSWLANPYRDADKKWFQMLHDLSKGAIPADADTWNASRDPGFLNLPYQPLAGLPAMVVFDQFGVIPGNTKAKVVDLTSDTRSDKRMSR